jgi:hypothetical protein
LTELGVELRRLRDRPGARNESPQEYPSPGNLSTDLTYAAPPAPQEDRRAMDLD